MEAEWAVLKEREVFCLVDPPPGMHIINSMWVYANKYNVDGNVIWCKVHLVAKGFSQIPGLKYDQTYDSVVRLESFRMVAAITAALNLVFSSPVKSSFFPSKRGNWQLQPV